MSDPLNLDSEALLETQMLRINRLCNKFEAGWQSGQPPLLEQVLGELTVAERPAALRDLLPLEIEYRQRAGETVQLADYAERFPDANRDWLASLFGVTRVSGTMPAALLQVPEKLGDYQILDRIGGGGMGTVYKALHVRMGRIVALKVLRPEIQQNPMLIQRFNREVRAAARLNHPHIVAALDAREQDGLHFLVTEFITGLDLEQTVRSRGPLPVAAAVDCILQAARGLEYAHRQGVLHRDIKPANLLRDERGMVKILDMGLARLEADTGHTATELTNSGMVLGTAAYMAPEQARDVRQADARSDIYSLGCTLYYLLTGRQAFSGATALDTVLSHLSQPIPPLTTADSQFPPELERIFVQMVAKNPQDRFQTAAEVIAALEQLSLPPQTTPTTTTVPKFDSINSSFPGDTLKIVASAGSTTPDLLSRPVRPRTAFRWWTGGLAVLMLMGMAITALVLFPRGSTLQPDNRQFALSFNGASSFVAVPTLNPTAGETYTLEAIVEPTGHRLSNVISWLGPDWMAIYLDRENWGLARRLQGNSHLILSDQSATLHKKVHLAGIFRNSELQLFVDGKHAASQIATFALPETEGGLYIGGVPSNKLPAGQNDRFFNGRIYAVRISRGIRYSASFQPPRTFKSDTQTLALYQFGDGQGTTVKDESGNGHNAHLSDAEWILDELPRSGRRPN